MTSLGHKATVAEAATARDSHMGTPQSISKANLMHHRLKDYLAGRISLDDLKERLIDATWDRPNEDDSPDPQLAYDIELVLAEASSG